jgi:hypothetical protein
VIIESPINKKLIFDTNISFVTNEPIIDTQIKNFPSCGMNGHTRKSHFAFLKKKKNTKNVTKKSIKYK